jgi:hypothetical protein
MVGPATRLSAERFGKTLPVRLIERLDAPFDAYSLGFLSRPARVVIAVLILGAIAFCWAVIAWDVAGGTTTSTEALIFPYVGFLAAIAIGGVACIDYVIQRLRTGRT